MGRTGVIIMVMSSKEAMIYLSEFIVSLSFTILAAFYPGIAESKGIPIWMIGLIFSMDPIFGLPTSIIAGKYMSQVGRKNILTVGLFLTGFGTLLIGLVDFGGKHETMIVSFCSRIIAGIGAGMSMTASSAILVLEYPEEIDRVVGWFEASSGLGLLLGPIVSSLLSLYKISISFTALGVVFMSFALFVNHYLIHSKKTSELTPSLPLISLILKPVQVKQRLLIDFCSQMLLIMSLGYLSTVIELYLVECGVANSYAGLVYSVCLFVYFVVSVLESLFVRCFSGKLLTFAGILGTALGFAVMSAVVPGGAHNVYVVSSGLAVLGFGGALMYSN